MPRRHLEHMPEDERERERDGTDGEYAEGDEADGAVRDDGRGEQKDATADDFAHDQSGGDRKPEAPGACRLPLPAPGTEGAPSERRLGRGRAAGGRSRL